MPQGLPPRTFVSFDAVAWVQRRLADVDSVEAAVAYMDELLKRNRIRWGTLSMFLHFDVI